MRGIATGGGKAVGPDLGRRARYFEASLTHVFMNLFLAAPVNLFSVAWSPRQVMPFGGKIGVRFAMLLRVILLLLAFKVCVAAPAADNNQAPGPADSRISVLSASEVIQILDQTVDWYRTLGAQQQNATQPSDLLILYANRQLADEVVDMVCEMARADAELLSGEASAGQGTAQSPTSSINQQHQELDAQRRLIQQEISENQQKLVSAGKVKQNLGSKLPELQSELAMVNARANLLDAMSEFVGQISAKGADAEALKAHIDAIAASIPTAKNSHATTQTPAGSATAPLAASSRSSEKLDPVARSGIWDLAQNMLRQRDKVKSIDDIDERTSALAEVFRKINAAPVAKLKAYSTRSDALASQADSAGNARLKDLRAEFDTLAWLFKQTSSVVIPLSKESVLLQQYRHNLSSWREAARRQYHDARAALGVRLGILVGLLAVVFLAAELWRHAVLRYVHDARHRYQLLLVRTILMWFTIVCILGLSLVTELSSFATFAGLITAGAAVAMQSVLVSIVGYFVLIGKYGVRVGDRVQIGPVIGEVINLGLVRLHLLELNEGPLGRTGRVVAFPNLIVFQSSGGLFKQIDGVNLSWHEMTVALPAVADYVALKEKLLTAVAAVVENYREEIERQTKEIGGMTVSQTKTEARPRVHIHIVDSQMQANIGYPVHLTHAAEIDERVSQAVLIVLDAQKK